MKLINAKATNYKSIEDSGNVPIEKDVTVLVGVNEAGKSAFLEALYKARPVLEGAKYDYVYDYPRKDFLDYEEVHPTNPAEVATLEYQLDTSEVTKVNEFIGFDLVEDLNFTVTHNYSNGNTIIFSLPEGELVKNLVKSSPLTGEGKTSASSASTLEELFATLEEIELSDESQAFVDELKKKYPTPPKGWHSTLRHAIWKSILLPNIPQFLYFSNYDTLPGKINFNDLKTKIDSGEELESELRTAEGLFDMAKIDLEKLSTPESFEEMRVRLESISLKISRHVFRYWKQNEELSVVFDVNTDSNDTPPFNNGRNLYISVKNMRHGASVPFNLRSKGFVWFFSFITWFNSVQNRIGTDKEIILLLDEPGTSLHGLAQADFLGYINDLSDKHQIIYTTHSPFMVNSDKMQQVRTVEDIADKGTVVSDSLDSSDKRTLFPLQAGLGYTIAQNLFIGKRNALVEGPADLIYWKYFSGVLEQDGRESLDDGIVIVPVGGLDKIATFVSLLSGNELDMAVVHDYEGSSDQRLDSLIKSKIIKDKQVMNYAQFRDPSDLKASDVEDMIGENLYLQLFNDTYSKELGGVKITAKDLPAGDRIVVRIEKYLNTKKIVLRKSGGFNHYLVASHLVANPIPKKALDKETLDRFEGLFKTVNKLLAE